MTCNGGGRRFVQGLGYVNSFVFEVTSKTEIFFLIIEVEKSRRKRISYSDGQVAELERHFRNSPHPDVYTREAIAQRLGVSETRALIWFKNRRAKEKRLNRQENQQANFNLSNAM